MNYEFHPEAEFEFIEAAAHDESEVPGLGERFGDEVERVVELLIENPKLGAVVEMVGFAQSTVARCAGRNFRGARRNGGAKCSLRDPGAGRISVFASLLPSRMIRIASSFQWETGSRTCITGDPPIKERDTSSRS